MKTFAEILITLSFFTRIPFKKVFRDSQTPPMAQLVWAFPLAGAILGLLCGVVYHLLYSAGLAPVLAALLTLTFELLITGGLHEDGLADTADGFAGGKDKESRLSIMRDSRIGSYGTLALILSLLLRATAITVLLQPSIVIMVYVVSGAMSRAMIAITMYALPNARVDGLAAWAGKPSRMQMYCSVILACIITLALLKTPGLALIVAAIIACDVMCIIAKQKIEGATGDVYGAIQQIVQITMLIVATAVLPT